MSARARLSNLQPWSRGTSGNARGSSRRARARGAARRLGHAAITALLEIDPDEADIDPHERWLDALRSTLNADDVLELVFPAEVLERLTDADLEALARISEHVRVLHEERSLAVREHSKTEKPR